MTAEQREKEIKHLEELSRRFIVELRTGEDFQARDTALRLHYGADLLWREKWKGKK
jgi:hypothetical protein